MSTTPLRRQYLEIKKQFPDVVVLFRLGDFYETFDDDAKIASSVLGITLTSRELGKGRRYPMAGIPYHSLDNHLGKLISAGYKVAICEQTSEPTEGKGLVERAVTRVVTAGTVVEPNLLDQKSNNYLAAVVIEDGMAGLAYVDITTSEFAVTQLPAAEVPLEIGRLSAAEVLFPAGSEVLPGAEGPLRSPLDPEAFDLTEGEERLRRHFGVASLEAYGCADLPLAIRAAGAILSYLADYQKGALAQISSLFTYSTASYMTLDPQPLLDRARIEERLEAVQWLADRGLARGKVIPLIGRVADIERLSNRVQSKIAGPRDVVALRRSLELVPEIRAVFEGEASEGDKGSALAPLVQLKPCEDTVALIANALTDESPLAVSDGDVIRPGFNEDLDRLREASRDARSYLANLERWERERTGIKSLKVGYNRVFGYYIEVSKSGQDQVPDYYTRKQTLVGGERYITPELKEYESLILNAQGRIQELEGSLFRQVCAQVAAGAEPILLTAAALAQIDVYAALAETAVRHNYTRPELSDGLVIDIVHGRHPVVERNLDLGSFVPNDTELSNDDAQIVILTGPNMAGKSTYLRQVGLIVLMAQIGSFVPADSARIGIVDRVFTRVGLQDDLATGQSTFMVEMVETAHILNNATPRSLIILDEIGRGTSTYDGLSIARAVAEFIHNHPRLGAKTLFATHYHELTEMAQYLPRVRNQHVAVAEEGGDVIFLHKIVPGGADRSYGVHVAQLAGLPRPVISRAQEVLTALEADGGRTRRKQSGGPKPAEPELQLRFFNARPEVVDDLMAIDVSSLTPLEAITKLFELQEKARENGQPPSTD